MKKKKRMTPEEVMASLQRPPTGDVWRRLSDDGQMVDIYFVPKETRDRALMVGLEQMLAGARVGSMTKMRWGIALAALARLKTGGPEASARKIWNQLQRYTEKKPLVVAGDDEGRVALFKVYRVDATDGDERLAEVLLVPGKDGKPIGKKPQTVKFRAFEGYVSLLKKIIPSL